MLAEVGTLRNLFSFVLSQCFQTEKSSLGEHISFINKAVSYVDTGKQLLLLLQPPPPPQPYIILVPSFHSSFSKIPTLTFWHTSSSTNLFNHMVLVLQIVSPPFYLSSHRASQNQSYAKLAKVHVIFNVQHQSSQ